MYYRKAARELSEAAAALSGHVRLVRQIGNVTLHALRDAGMLEFEKDERGETRYDSDTGLPAIVSTEELTYMFRPPKPGEP